MVSVYLNKDYMPDLNCEQSSEKTQCALHKSLFVSEASPVCCQIPLLLTELLTDRLPPMCTCFKNTLHFLTLLCQPNPYDSYWKPNLTRTNCYVETIYILPILLYSNYILPFKFLFIWSFVTIFDCNISSHWRNYLESTLSPLQPISQQSA